MKAELTYTYDGDEVCEIVLAQHLTIVGLPPKGYEWVAHKPSYSSEIEVTAIANKKATAVEPPVATTPTKEPVV